MERKIDRLDRFAEFRNLTDNQMTQLAHLAVGTFSKSRKPGKDITRRTAEAVLEAFPDLSRQWLLNGEGEMLAEFEPTMPKSYPLIDYATAECGRPFGELEGHCLEEMARIALPDIPQGTEFFVRASGYSMINDTHRELSIPPGAYVGLARLNGGLIRWGEVYALATTDGMMIKRVLLDRDNPDVIRCASYNAEEYPEFSINRSDVFDFARITCVVPVYVR